MKKVFVYILLFVYILVLLKFYISDYNISYNYEDYEIKEIAKDDYFLLDIKFDNKVYNYVFNEKRGLFKKKVNKVKTDEVNGYVCLLPVINGFDSYFVCNNGEEMVSYQVAKGEDNYETNVDNFKYYENLNNNEHVYIWKYDGFYYLNGSEYKSINILNKDRYSNDLMFASNGYLVFPYYNTDYLFSDFVILDMSSGEYDILETKYDISYDSYIVGNIKNKLYLFDNKEKKLYEINYKKESIKLIGDERKGYIKYVNGKKKDALKEEYTKDKITYFDNINDLIKVNKNHLSYDFNKKESFKYFKNDDINNVVVYDDNVYFIYKDKLYKYNSSKADVVLHYFEFNFNNKNSIFIYNE